MFYHFLERKTFDKQKECSYTTTFLAFDNDRNMFPKAEKP